MISFGIWATDEATFWQSWIAAGIALAPNVIAPEYRELQLSTQTQQGWSPMRPTGATDERGNPVMEPAPGFHANARVLPGSRLYAEFTYGLAQTNPDGTLKSIWDRTWATHVFNLEYAEADPDTGFKAGHRSVTYPTVRYADSALWASPANVIA